MISEILAAVGIAVTAAMYPPPAADFDAPQEPEPAVTVDAEPANDAFAAETVVTWEEPCCEQAWTAPAQEWTAPDTSDGVSADEFRWMGVVQDGDTRYTWYSQNTLAGGGLDELNANGRHVEGGYVMDGEGYIAVASSDHEIGTVLDTPFGQAKVYDCGCADGVTDYYTNWG